MCNLNMKERQAKIRDTSVYFLEFGSPATGPYVFIEKTVNDHSWSKAPFELLATTFIAPLDDHITSLLRARSITARLNYPVALSMEELMIGFILLFLPSIFFPSWYACTGRSCSLINDSWSNHYGSIWERSMELILIKNHSLAAKHIFHREVILLTDFGMN